VCVGGDEKTKLERREFRWKRNRPEVKIAVSGCRGWGRSENRSLNGTKCN